MLLTSSAPIVKEFEIEIVRTFDIIEDNPQVNLKPFSTILKEFEIEVKNTLAPIEDNPQVELQSFSTIVYEYEISVVNPIDFVKDFDIYIIGNVPGGTIDLTLVRLPSYNAVMPFTYIKVR